MPDTIPITTGNDLILAQAHGFDQQSFRQSAPGNKKIRRKKTNIASLNQKMIYEFNQFSFFGRYLLNHIYKNNRPHQELVTLTQSRNYLQKIVRELNLEMHLTWTTEDVYHVIKQRLLSQSINPQQEFISEDHAKRVLLYTYENHDKHKGVNYETIYQNICILMATEQIKIVTQ